jgi:predicted alpha/beta superfamily hydrolase
MFQMVRRATTLLSTGLLVAGCTAGLKEGRDQSARESIVPPAYLAGVESRVITSSRTGRAYQVSVALPRGYQDSSTSFPVVYSLDANGEFGIVVETAQLLQLEELIPEVVIVGIGYPVGHYFDAIGKRALDLTVTNRDSELREIFMKASRGFPPPEGTGGAPGFLQFLTGELIPLIEAEYRVDPRNRALFGHSFGGLFAFHALLHGKGAFQRFIIASPALWWDDRQLSRRGCVRSRERHSRIERRQRAQVGSEQALGALAAAGRPGHKQRFTDFCAYLCASDGDQFGIGVWSPT